MKQAPPPAGTPLKSSEIVWQFPYSFPLGLLVCLSACQSKIKKEENWFEFCINRHTKLDLLSACPTKNWSPKIKVCTFAILVSFSSSKAPKTHFQLYHVNLQQCITTNLIVDSCYCYSLITLCSDLKSMKAHMQAANIFLFYKETKSAFGAVYLQNLKYMVSTTSRGHFKCHIQVSGNSLAYCTHKCVKRRMPMHVTMDQFPPLLNWYVLSIILLAVLPTT